MPAAGPESASVDDGAHLRRTAAVPGAKATAGAHVVEAQRHGRPPSPALRCRPRRAARAAASSSPAAGTFRSSSARRSRAGGELDARCRSRPGRSRRQAAPAIGLAGPWSGFVPGDVEVVDPAPALAAGERDRARVAPAGCCRSAPCGRRCRRRCRRSRSRSALTACGPSLKLRSCRPPGARRGVESGRAASASPRHSPPIEAFAQGYSVRPTRGAVDAASPRSGRRRRGRRPRRGAPGRRAASRRRAGRRRSRPPGRCCPRSVIVSARSADHELGVEASTTCSLRGRRAGGLRRPASARRKPSDEVAQGRCRCAAGGEDGRSRRRRSTPPSRCSIPSWRACHQVPRTSVMPVPGGRRPAPAGEAGAGDRPLAVAREALQVGAVEGIGAGRRHAAGVGAELGAAGGVGPVGVGADVPAALGDRVVAGPRLARRQQQQRRPPARPPSRRSAPAHRACPTSPSSSRFDRVPEAKGGRAELSPLGPAAPKPPDRAFARMRANGTPHQGSGHRAAPRRHRPRAAPLDRRARHGPLDRHPGERPGRGDRLADHRRLPDPLPLRTGRRPAGHRARRGDRGRRSASTSSPTRRKAPCSRRSAAASCRRARWPRSRT